jgi:hypothetical protein
MTEVVIPRRFVGPPDSGHGGYSCGVAALAVTDGPAEVTLRRPPPVERALDVEVVAGHATVRDGDLVVAEAREGQLVVDLPDPVSFADASRAAAGFDVDDYTSWHPFPTCFACGPRRGAGDGLRIFPAAAGKGLVAWPWVPDPSIAGPDGLVEPVMLWAALDCPSGLSWYHDQRTAGPHVLGRMVAEVRRRPAPGEELVAAGWDLGPEGRKRAAGSVVWADGGEVVARNLATWIALTPEQQAAFGTADRP